MHILDQRTPRTSGLHPTNSNRSPSRASTTRQCQRSWCQQWQWILVLACFALVLENWMLRSRLVALNGVRGQLRRVTTSCA